MSKRKITVGVVTIILLVVGSVWAFRSRTDPQVEKVKQLQAEARKPGATPEQRTLVRQEWDKLSPEQQDNIRQQRGQDFQRRVDEQIKEYFTLPPPQRIAYLDKQINEMEKWRKDWEARRAQAGQSGGQGQGGAGGQTAGAGGGQARGGRSGNTDERMMRRDARLDNSTAQQRAQRSAYFADLRARRIQLGLPSSPFGGGRGPR